MSSQAPRHTADPTPPELRVGASETATLLHATDWSATALGPMEGWPRALRIAVGICLNSRFPMFVWWGPKLVNIYNDAYIPILGKRHPHAYGRSAPTIWGEIWPIVGPQAEAVMQRGEATWNERVLLVMERNDYVEDTYFTWSYSPIPDDEGGIGGVFCACTEETPRVLAERQRDRLLEQIESERTKLADAFAQSPSFLAVLRERDHVYEFVNERYRELIGQRDTIGRPVREVLPELEGQGFFEILDRVYETGEPFVGTAMRIAIRRRAGGPLETAYLDFVYQSIRAADGAITGILAHGVDVTERQRSEMRDRFLLTLDDAVRALTEPAEITATYARLLGEYIDADRCAYADVEDDENTFNLTGDYNRDVPSIVGRYRFSDFGDEVLRLMRDDRAFMVNDVDTHQRPLGDLSSYREARIQAMICVPLHKAGRVVAAMAVHQKTPRVWSAGEVELVRHVASRCWESIERARVGRTLLESEARFRQLADAMPQIVFAASPGGVIEYFNRQWYEYTGLPEGAAGTDTWKSVHTEDGLRRVMEAWPKALESGQPYEIEYPLRRHDGEYRWHLGRALPIRNEQGEIVRWFGTNTDIHDRKRIEDALAHALDAESSARSAAERASRMKDEFLATLSHELRTPLNAILGWSQIIGLNRALPADLAKGVDVIQRNARAQAQIIEDLLDMSAIISGKVRLELAQVNLVPLVQAAVDAARPAADAKRIRLEHVIESVHDLAISADASRIQQIFWNLINNAVKFTPAEGSVQVSLRHTDAQVEVSVTDTGEGIEATFLPFVFDRFRQADATSTRRYGGLGLGLAIVKQLVELHGGTVRAASPGAGSGATFVVTLPFVSQAGASGAGPGAQRPPQPIAPLEECAKVAGLRVLVVDDDADARDLVRRLLEDCGSQVTTASSAAEALSALEQERFDVLVSDVGMPHQNGYALLQRVRALESTRGGGIPAIALTAYARPDDRQAALRAGFHLHLAKPIEPTELIATIASLAGRA